MRTTILAGLIAISSVGMVAQAGQTASEPTNPFGFKTRCDYALDGLQSVKDNFDHSDPTTRALIRGQYWDACMSIARAHCSECNGFECTAPGSQAIERCGQVQNLASELGTSETTFHSEKASSQGIHFVSFKFPMNVFELDMVNISFQVKAGAAPATIPSLTGDNDQLYITSDFKDGARFTCKPVGLGAIDGTVVNPQHIWDGRHGQAIGQGATRDDITFLRDEARCMAFGNQAFTITVGPAQGDPATTPTEDEDLIN